MHLERTLLSSLHLRAKHHGRGQSHASNEKGKYLGRWPSPPHSMLYTNWVGHIYEEKTPKQWLNSSQLSLPPLEGSWWDKHPNYPPETYIWRVEMQWEGLYKERNPFRKRDEHSNNGEKERTKIYYKRIYFDCYWSTPPWICPRKNLH